MIPPKLEIIDAMTDIIKSGAVACDDIKEVSNMLLELNDNKEPRGYCIEILHDAIKLNMRLRNLKNRIRMIHVIPAY